MQRFGQRSSCIRQRQNQKFCMYEKSSLTNGIRGVGIKTPSRGGVSYYFVFFLLFSLNQIIKKYSQQIKNGPVNPSGPPNGVWKKICHKGKYNRTLYSFICSARHQVNSLTLRPLKLFSSRMSCTYDRCTLCTLAHTTAVHYIDDDDNWPSRDYKREWVQTFDAEISGVVLVGKELIIHHWLKELCHGYCACLHLTDANDVNKAMFIWAHVKSRLALRNLHQDSLFSMEPLAEISLS